MANTNLNNLVNPEVMADMLQTSIPAKIKFAPLAEVDTKLEGQAGNTVTIPKFSYVGDAEDVAEGVAMGTTVLSATTSKVTIKKIGKAIELTKEAVLSGYGDPVGEANNQIAQAMAAKVDQDLVGVLNGATLTYDGSAGAVDYAGIVSANAKFADEDDEVKVLFIHPNQLKSILLDPNFINKPDNSLMAGSVGQIAGCQIVRSNRVPFDGVNYTNFIVKQGALGIYLKKDVEVETDKDILAGTVVIAGTQYYAVALKDESKAVKATFKA